MKNSKNEIYNNVYHTMFECAFNKNEKNKILNLTKNKSKKNAIDCTQKLIYDVFKTIDIDIDRYIK